MPKWSKCWEADDWKQCVRWIVETCTSEETEKEGLDKYLRHYIGWSGDYQDNKADVILKYNADEARSLKAYSDFQNMLKSMKLIHLVLEMMMKSVWWHRRWWWRHWWYLKRTQPCTFQFSLKIVQQFECLTVSLIKIKVSLAAQKKKKYMSYKAWVGEGVK